MSTRWYPLYVRGNPQLRIFLPNFWMRLIKPEHRNSPPNIVHFEVSSQMTRLDVKNYLTQIYKIPAMDVKTFNLSGKTHRVLWSKKQELYKDDDVKVAVVTLPTDYKFEFPDITQNQESEVPAETTAKKDLDLCKANFQKWAKSQGGSRKGAPPFFGL